MHFSIICNTKILILFDKLFKNINFNILNEFFISYSNDDCIFIIKNFICTIFCKYKINNIRCYKCNLCKVFDEKNCFIEF